MNILYFTRTGRSSIVAGVIRPVSTETDCMYLRAGEGMILNMFIV
jgi:hypothetical protein